MGTLARVWVAVWMVAAITPCGCAGSGNGNGDGATEVASTSTIFSCTVSQNDGMRVYDVVCLEGTAGVRTTVQAACNAPDAGPSPSNVTNTGHFAQQPCARDGSVGGCMISFGGNWQTSWYYPGVSSTTAAQIQQLCAGTGGTFVAP